MQAHLSVPITTMTAPFPDVAYLDATKHNRQWLRDLAQLDSELVPLVGRLNDHAEIITWHSCAGHIRLCRSMERDDVVRGYATYCDDLDIYMSGRSDIAMPAWYEGEESRIYCSNGAAPCLAFSVTQRLEPFATHLQEQSQRYGWQFHVDDVRGERDDSQDLVRRYWLSLYEDEGMDRSLEGWHRNGDAAFARFWDAVAEAWRMHVEPSVELPVPRRFHYDRRWYECRRCERRATRVRCVSRVEATARWFATYDPAGNREFEALHLIDF